jgi:hypothetical protein
MVSRDRRVIIATAAKDVYLKIILEGKHNASWDIDAYFDEVSVKWQYVPKMP